MPREHDFGSDGVPSDDCSSDPALRTFGLMQCGEDGDLPVASKVMERVTFVDNPKNPRGKGRLDLSTGTRHW